jgi:hypothetical protein
MRTVTVLRLPARRAAKVRGGRAPGSIPHGARVFPVPLFDGRGLVVASLTVEQP